MKLTKTLAFVLLMVMTSRLFAQSQHDFIQFDMNPVFTNPAQTGAYEGTYRAGGIYRSQWNVASAVYTPLTAYVDAPLLLIAKRHWVGLGVQYNKDVAGTHNLGTQLTALSGAFHYALDKRYRNVFTIGAQFGAGRTGIDAPDASAFPSLVAADLKPKSSFTDLNLGLLFKSTIDKNSKFSIGLAVNNLLKGKSSLLKTPNPKGRIPIYQALTVNYDRNLNKKLSLHPTLMVQKQAASLTSKAQCLVGYKMQMKGKEQPIVLKAGAGYFMGGNQAAVIVGADIKDLRVGVGYGINLGGLQNAASNSMEIAVQYVGKIYKKPTVKPALVCPKY